MKLMFVFLSELIKPPPPPTTPSITHHPTTPPPPPPLLPPTPNQWEHWNPFHGVLWWSCVWISIWLVLVMHLVQDCGNSIANAMTVFEIRPIFGDWIPVKIALLSFDILGHICKLIENQHCRSLNMHIMTQVFNMPAFVQVMDWCWTWSNPLSEPVMA